MNINPVFEKEIKRHTRSIKISMVVCASNLLLGSIALTCFLEKAQQLDLCGLPVMQCLPDAI